MKSSLLLLLVFACGLAFGQQTISELTSTSKEATIELEYIIDLDVFSYFNLKDYDSDLKKSVFLKSEEGQTKLNELKKIKAEMLKTTYYARLSNGFIYSNYDITKKGFPIVLGNNMRSPTRTPKSIALDEDGERRVLLKALPSKQVFNSSLSEGAKLSGHNLTVYSEELFLSMSEESGLEVENDKENTEIYFFFTPTGREQTVFKYYELDFKKMLNGVMSYNLNNVTHNDIKADRVRIVVANKSSGKILSDKSFSYQVPGTKK